MQFFDFVKHRLTFYAIFVPRGLKLQKRTTEYNYVAATLGI